MKLNIDCIRDLLLCIEDNTTYSHPVVFTNVCMDAKTTEFLGIKDKTVFPYQSNLVKKYGEESFMYHLKYCLEDHLLESSSGIYNTQIVINDLTPKGHKTIAAIRSQSILNKSKNMAEQIGVQGIYGIINIATLILQQTIRTNLGL